MRVCCVISLFILTCGCTARDPAPELNDPIYLSFNTEVLSAQKSLEESLKDLETSRAQMEQTEMITGVPRHERVQKLLKAEAAARVAQQRLDYLIARRSVRQREDRISYNKAKNVGAVWPPPGELAQLEREHELGKRTRDYSAVHEDRLKKLAPSRSIASKGEASEGGEKKSAHE